MITIGFLGLLHCRWTRVRGRNVLWLSLLPRRRIQCQGGRQLVSSSRIWTSVRKAAGVVLQARRLMTLFSQAGNCCKIEIRQTSRYWVPTRCPLAGVEPLVPPRGGRGVSFGWLVKRGSRGCVGGSWRGYRPPNTHSLSLVWDCIWRLRSDLVHCLVILWCQRSVVAAVFSLLLNSWWPNMEPTTSSSSSSFVLFLKKIWNLLLRTNMLVTHPRFSLTTEIIYLRSLEVHGNQEDSMRFEWRWGHGALGCRCVSIILMGGVSVICYSIRKSPKDIGK